MNKYELTYKAFGADAVLIEWPQQVNVSILKDIKIFEINISNRLADYVVECIPAYASLTIIYKNVNYAFITDSLKELYEHLENIMLKNVNYLWKLPVCYHPSFGLDLETYSEIINLGIPEIINLHTSTVYTIYFTGFLPGFLYLGGLDKRLYATRKATPLLEVPKGAVAIGGKQTGIYPQISPGGWHIIGNSPVRLFNPLNNPPSLFKAADQVQFYAIELEAYKNNFFEITKEPIHD